MSFLTQASIAFTPFVETFFGEPVKNLVWAGCLSALVGVVTLGMDPGGQSVELVSSVMPKGLSVNIGDLIALGGALTYSLYVFRIGAFTKLGLDGSQLQGVEIVLFGVYVFRVGVHRFRVTQSRDDDDNTVCRVERPDHLVVDCILGDRWGVLGRCRSGERARIVSASETQVIYPANRCSRRS